MTRPFFCRINKNPKTKDIGAIKIYVSIIPEHDHAHHDDEDHVDDNTLQFFTWSLVEELLSNQECKSRKDLELFLREDARLIDYESDHLIMDLISYVYQIRQSNEYSPNYLLSLWLTLHVHYHDSISEDDEDAEYCSIEFRPANKLVMENLNKKIYEKTSKSMKEICTICLEEMKNGENVATLPCGHEFDEKCVMEWLATSHVCPLCRFQLLCD